MEFIQGIDDAIMHACQAAPVWLSDMMASFTAMGDFGILWIIAAAALLLLNGYRRYGALLGVTVASGWMLNELLIKNLVCRPRPFVANVLTLAIDEASGYSFMSGHSLVSFAAATVIFRANRRIGILAYVIAALMAASRVVLCVHYFSDALCGSIFGILWGMLGIYIAKRAGIIRFNESRGKKIL